MIILYGAGPGFGLPEISPFVMKAEAQLKLLRLPHEKRRVELSDGAKTPVPFIDDEGVVIGNPGAIRAHLETRAGCALDVRLDAAGRSEAAALERMIEDDLVRVASYARSVIHESFDKRHGRWLEQAPIALRDTLRDDLHARISDALRIKGIGRHSPNEIAELAGRTLETLSLRLGAQRYLLGEEPCGADASALGLLGMVLAPSFDSRLRRRAETFDNLVAYTDRMIARFYPGYPWKRHISPWAA